MKTEGEHQNIKKTWGTYLCQHTFPSNLYWISSSTAFWVILCEAFTPWRCQGKYINLCSAHPIFPVNCSFVSCCSLLLIELWICNHLFSYHGEGYKGQTGLDLKLHHQIIVTIFDLLNRRRVICSVCMPHWFCNLRNLLFSQVFRQLPCVCLYASAQFPEWGQANRPAGPCSKYKQHEEPVYFQI